MLLRKCDGCSKELPKGALRYSVSIDVRAAYDGMEVGLAELIRDHRAELVALIEKLRDVDAKEIEETVYKLVKFDLCPSCQKAYIKDPLRFHPEQAPDSSELNIDTFLRSLGYGHQEG